MNNFYIGFAYDGAWTIVHGAKDSVVNWIVNNTGKHVYGRGCQSESQVQQQIEYCKVAEEYENPTIIQFA